MCTEWWKNLKVGDKVCDCRRKHLQVVDIFEERYPRHWIQRLILLLPQRLWNPLYDRLSWRFLGKTWDLILTLEDGNQCSANNCAEPEETCSCKWEKCENCTELMETCFCDE